MAAFVFIAILLLAFSAMCLIIGPPWPTKKKKEEIATEKPKSAPPVDPIVLAIVRSLQDEPHRWEKLGTSFWRDDGLSTSELIDKVWVYDDLRKSSERGGIEHCRVTIPGEQNVRALEDAYRIFRVKHDLDPPSTVEIKDILADKLGVNSVD